MPTTATRWLDDNPGDVAALEELVAGSGLPFRVFTEMPLGMKQQIARNLAESFQQPYWDDISKTTGGDAERFLRQGLREGWSIRDMADRMATSFEGDTYKYAKKRATNIARTESGYALNSARKASMDSLAEELGPDVPMRPTWLSVLGDTTRDEHADLDGVPADENGMWNLAGYVIPVPGHWSLPPEQRCQCHCSITLELGMGKVEASQLISQYEERIQAGEPNRGRFSSGGGGGQSVPSEMSKSDVDDLFDELEEGVSSLPERLGSEISGYVGDDARRINGILRRRETPSKEDVRKIRKIDESIDGVWSTRESVLFRGIEKGVWDRHFGDLTVGSKFLDRGYQSTSTSRSIAEGFGDGGILAIKTKKGQNMLPVGGIGEMEILLPRKMKMRVVGVHENILVVEPIKGK